MPSTYTRYPVDTERKDPGTGGKPPVDRRHTGGGGNGDDDDWKHLSSKGPRELLTRYRYMTGIVIVSDLFFFIALALVFYVHQGMGHISPRGQEFIGDWHPVALPPILFLNTAVLLLSGLTMEIARRHIFHELDVVEEWLGMGRPALRRTLPWLAATLVLGGLFVAGQLTGWFQLTREGFGFDRSATPAVYAFYILTGMHALHLLVGMLALTASLFGLRTLKKVEYRQIAVDCLNWYWHFMSVTWLMLFAVLAWA
jgi:cytochrome c oxidase subunit III